MLGKQVCKFDPSGDITKVVLHAAFLPWHVALEVVEARKARPMPAILDRKGFGNLYVL